MFSDCLASHQPPSQLNPVGVSASRAGDIMSAFVYRNAPMVSNARSCKNSFEINTEIS